MNKRKYREVTMEHINQVRIFLLCCIQGLTNRANIHDLTKLKWPEIDIFIEYVPKLQNSKYGSSEYKRFLKEMEPALTHHYANNRHHPEHFKNNIKGMNLLDLIEMFCDWMASVKRHKTGNIRKSIQLNQKRFRYSDELRQILENTIEIFDQDGT